MSMVMMPLLIKVKMSKENYARLLAEASKRYFRMYLKKNYHYDGSYFLLDVCDMDNFEIFTEAALIAKYASPTSDSVGLIYDGGESFSVTELWFANGGCHTEKPLSNNPSGGYPLYQKKKEAFLNRFPAASKQPDPTGKLLPLIDDSRTYTCIGLSLNALDSFFEKEGYHVEEIIEEYGRVTVCLLDSEEYPEDILARYYHCDKVTLLSVDASNLAAQCLMVLIYNEEQRSVFEDDYKAFYDRIHAMHSCNDCGTRNSCKYAPRPGQPVRINCPHWAERGV